MGEKIKPFLDKTGTALKKVSKKVYIALAALVLLAVAVVIFLNTRPYEILFTDLSSNEMQSILEYLDANGAGDYQVEDSDTILVPASQEANLKMRLLMEGYPKSGFAYTYDTPSSPLSTESERAAESLRRLEAKLSSVVRNFAGIQDASVTINPGEDKSYVLDSNRVVNATAAVFLTMKEPGDRLTDEQADAIRNLIAHSVKGLEISSVSISDAAGNTYSTRDEAMDAEASELKMKLEEEHANKIRSEVFQALMPYYGADNVRVSVNCSVDVSRTVENSTDVRLPEWADDGSTNGRGIVGSRIYNYVVVRDEDEPAGGTVGTSTNADIPEYVEDLPELNGDESELDLSGQVDYDNSRTEKQIIRTAGYLTDCMISVSINSTVAGDVDQQELKQHIARAAGIVGVKDPETGVELLDDKISVMAKPFYDPDAGLVIPASPVESWVLVAAGIGLLVFLLIVTLVVLIRKKRKKKKMKKLLAAQAAAQGAVPAGDGESMLTEVGTLAQQPETGADVMSLQTERSIELRQDIRKFAEENPEIAAQMIKNWLRGDEDNG